MMRLILFKHFFHKKTQGCVYCNMFGKKLVGRSGFYIFVSFCCTSVDFVSIKETES